MKIWKVFFKGALLPNRVYFRLSSFISYEWHVAKSTLFNTKCVENSTKNFNFKLQQIRHLSLNHDLTTLEANRPINRVLNRYRDVLPYDHSRVVLWDYEATDYINASLVEVSHLQDDQLPVCYTIALLKMFTNLSRLQIFIQLDEWFIFVPGVWTSFGHYFSKKYLNSKK